MNQVSTDRYSNFFLRISLWGNFYSGTGIMQGSTEQNRFVPRTKLIKNWTSPDRD